MNRHFPLLALLVALGSCNEDKERYEEIKKLRAIGASACASELNAPSPSCTKIIGEPSTAATPRIFTVTFYAALPLGQTVEAAPFTDTGSKYAATIPLNVVQGSEHYEEHNAFRLYTVQATAPIPNALPPGQNFARLRYGLSLKSGAEEERIVGNLLVYPAGAAELNWSQPTLDIASPVADAHLSGKKTDITANLSTDNQENLRIGWFVSGGKIKNRRAKTTEWETPGAGSHTLLVTVRGMKSGAFGVKVVDVNID